MAGREMAVSANVIHCGHNVASEWLVVPNSVSLGNIYRAVLSLWSKRSSRDSATDPFADAQVMEIVTTFNGGRRRKQILSDLVDDNAQIISFLLDKDKCTETLAYETHLAKLGLFRTDNWPAGTSLAASVAATLDKNSPGIQRLSVDFPLKGTITESALQKYFANEGKQRQPGPSGQIGETLPPSSLPQPTKKQDPRTWANKGNQRQPTSEQIGVTPLPSTPEQIRAPPEVPHPTLLKPTKSTDSGPSQGGGSGEVLQGHDTLFSLAFLLDMWTWDGKGKRGQIVAFTLLIIALFVGLCK